MATLASLVKLTTLSLLSPLFIHIENLRLHDNDFSGPLPDSIKSLTNLSTSFYKCLDRILRPSTKRSNSHLAFFFLDAESVELWRTNLAGPIVQYAASWPNLGMLHHFEFEDAFGKRIRSPHLYSFFHGRGAVDCRKLQH